MVGSMASARAIPGEGRSAAAAAIIAGAARDRRRPGRLCGFGDMLELCFLASTPLARAERRSALCTTAGGVTGGVACGVAGGVARWRRSVASPCGVALAVTAGTTGA